MGIDSRMVVLRKRQKDAFVLRFGGWNYFLGSIKHKVKKLLRLPDELNECRQLARKDGRVYTLPVSNIDLWRCKAVREADVLVIHWVGGYLDYRTFFKQLSVPVIFVMHDENCICGIANTPDVRPKHPLEDKYFALKLHVMQSLKHAGVVFTSQDSYQQFSNLPILKGLKKAVIHNSVDTSRFIRTDKQAARASLNLPQTATLFAFCAYNITDKGKGLDVLSATLLRINPDYRILAVGNNRQKATWPNVISIGKLDSPEQIAVVYSASDYFCMPSFKEHFAQSPLEAMACGLPVVAFPWSGTTELITPENGIRCADFTSEALEEGLRKALSTSYDGQKIRQDMAERFAPEQIARTYLDFCNTL